MKFSKTTSYIACIKRVDRVTPCGFFRISTYSDRRYFIQVLKGERVMPVHFRKKYSTIYYDIPSLKKAKVVLAAMMALPSHAWPFDFSSLLSS